MDNILLIGDFRDCINYGAIATTEMLLKMLETKTDAEHLRTIYHRSFNGDTPVQGWLESGEEYRKRKSKEVTHPHGKEKILNELDGSPILNVYKAIKKEIRKTKGCSTGFEIEKFHVPYRFDDFDTFAGKVMRNETLQYEKSMLEWADIVLINAEGSLVKGTDANGYYHVTGLYPLYMAFLSKKYFGKKCYVINHTVDPQNRDIMYMIGKIYPMLDGIYIREPLSSKILDQCGVKNYEFIPDALFSFSGDNDWEPSEYILKTVDFSQPYICLGDSSGFYTDRNHIWDVEKTYGQLIDKLRAICPQIIFVVGFGQYFPPIMQVIKEKNIPYVSVNNTTYSDVYHILEKAEIFISGRWHTSILALLAETPILLFGSDSHKTEALYEMIHYPYRFFDVRTLPINIDGIINEAKLITESDNTEYFSYVKDYAIASKENVKMLI